MIFPKKNIKYIKYRLFLLVVLSLFLSDIKAQSIPELIQLSESNNLALKALHQSYLSALEKGAQVSQRPDPEFSVGFFALPIETRLGVQRLRLGAMQLFPQKGLLKAKEEVLNTMAKVNLEQIAATQLAINFQIKKAYFQLYQLERSKAIVQRNIRIFKAIEQLTLAKVESGQGSTAEVLKTALKIQELAQQLEVLEHQKQKPITILNQLLNRDLDASITIMDSLALAEIPYDIPTLAATIQANHPVIEMFNIQQEVANKNLKINQLGQRPTFGIGVDYIIMDKLDNFEFAKNGRDVIIPKASLKIPLYKKKYGAKQREEELKIAALATQKENSLKEFLAKINLAYTDYEEAKLNLTLYQEQIRLTKGVINVLETQYSAEGKGFDELLSMQTSLVNYDLLILKEIVKSHIAKAEIEQYIE